ncbi:3-phosphoshikimate 1-carboxyvinyltransferase [Thermocrinis minervae]|uniref:3-phosphoshikimate 1-carboxyvinyltransferase n=1 Tax=Thermocrinis minervae TaxID=381751 RepID=A0A1M6QE11_9AQUI|nr:3-phosphoshikimate 1-carboxyvinyltransferase [Thermocrinis minervae]SHK18482.1 3-phosphoshikimate 1-carboxyvinyltransferase [Thermocrinis minervae]
MELSRVKLVKGQIRVPSDKSISHRAVILGAIAEGKTYVEDWLVSADTLATLRVIRSLGVKVVRKGTNLVIEGTDYTFREPQDVLNCANSGTTARLMLGVLSTQPFFSVLTGDRSLRNRPMLRVVEPLRQMGASLDGRHHADKLPICVRGGSLKGISFFNKRASAQVKSSLLLAGLRAEGYTEISEPYSSRDHTERMLKAFGVNLYKMEGKDGHIVKMEGFQKLYGTKVVCPADPSSAAFFCALALLVEGSELILKDVLVNPTRDGFYRKVRQMGGHVEYTNLRELGGEPVADVVVRGGNRLKSVEVKPEEVPSLIDELPILAVLMAFAEGTSVVRGAQELRVKESDRIKAIVENLRAMGAKVEELEDGFIIEGSMSLKGATIKTYGDHRIAMAFSVAGLVAQGKTYIDDPNCVKVSYPNFYKDLFSVVQT